LLIGLLEVEAAGGDAVQGTGQRRPGRVVENGGLDPDEQTFTEKLH
jgi:hypothetical protein